MKRRRRRRRSKQMFFTFLFRVKKLEGRFIQSPITKVVGYSTLKNTQHPKLS
jgi:hypothetical protein